MRGAPRMQRPKMMTLTSHASDWTEPFRPDITRPLALSAEVLQHVLGLRPWSDAQEFEALVQPVADAGAKVSVRPVRAGRYGEVSFTISQEALDFISVSFKMSQEAVCLTVGRFVALLAPMYARQLQALANMCERALMTSARRAEQAARDSERLGAYIEPGTGRIYFEEQWYAGVPTIAEELGCSRWVLNERMRNNHFTLAEAVADIRQHGVAAPRVAKRAEVDGKVYPSVREAMRSLGYQGTWELPKLVARGTVKLLEPAAAVA